MLFTETGRTAYLNAAVASQAAPGLELSTGVAVAFPRSPFVTAATAWELQEATGGKFRLGLGTHARTHVVRRYGMEFERPGPRLRDYVLAVKACFGAFRTGKLDNHGESYDLDFITPQWSAGPIDAPDPKVDVAAVNPWMLRMAGEVADGVHMHLLGEPGYIARHVVPNVAEGAAKSGRSPSEVAVIVPVMTIAGDSDDERHNERELVRASKSFYGSTPNYAFVWDAAGFEGRRRGSGRSRRPATSRGWRRRSRTSTSRRSPRSRRGRLGRRANREVRRNRHAHRLIQRARRSGALRTIRQRCTTHIERLTSTAESTAGGAYQGCEIITALKNRLRGNATPCERGLFARGGAQT